MTGLHPAREHLALALDVDSLDAAVGLLRRLRPWFGVAKVGLQLFASAGPDAITAARSEGFDVFADLKLHDIPTTVGRAAAAIGATGARYLTTHTAGGGPMVRVALDGFTAGADGAGHPPPILLGVTVLTSDADTGPETFDRRVAVAVDAGCPGLVCSPLDAARARSLYPAAVLVCPGVRLPGTSADDQARVATPGAAIRSGADLLVVGRPVTAARDPVRAAEAVADDVAAALSA